MPQYQLPGVQDLTKTKPFAAVFVAGGLLVGILAVTYMWPHLGAAQPAPSIPTQSSASIVPPPAPPVTDSRDVDDVRHHLDVGREELLRSTEALVRAERAWTVVTARLNRNYLTEERNRADDGTAAARAARAAIERALDEVQIAREHLN